jgi:DinB family protein
MAENVGALKAWRSIPGLMQELVGGRTAEELDTREGSAMSRREILHHVAEANTVAASIVIAALGSPGCVYDWSWMQPSGDWMKRLEYERKPIAPALTLLEALNDYVAALVEPLRDGLARPVRLRDAPGGELRSVTVADVLLAEAEHARQHIAEARSLLAKPRRPEPREKRPDDTWA